MRTLSVKDWIIIIAGVIGLVVFILLYPKVYPESAMRGMISEEAAITKSQQWMSSGWAKAPRSMDSLTLRASIRVDQKQLEYLQEKFGLEQANKHLRNKSLVYTRQLEWLRIDEVNIQFGGRTQGNSSAKTERVVIELDRLGNIVGYRYTKAKQDTSPVTDLETTHPSIAATEGFDLDSARRMAREFLRQWAGRSPDDFRESDVQGSITGKKPVMEFVFTGIAPTDEVYERVKLRIENYRIANFEREWLYPAGFIDPENRWERETTNTLGMIFFILFSIMVVVLFFRQFKRGGIDFKVGSFFGILSAVSFALMIGVQLLASGFWTLSFVVLIAGGWYFIMTTGIIAVTASEVYRFWPESYRTFEAIRRGKIINRRWGRSLALGMAWTGITIGAISLVLYIVPGTSFLLNSKSTDKYDGYGALFLIGASIWTVLIHHHLFYLLPLSALRKRWKNPAAVIGIAALVGILQPYIFDTVSPWEPRLLAGLLIGIIYGTILLNYDFLTLSVSASLAYLISESGFLYYTSDIPGMVIVGVYLCSFLTLALIALWSRDSGDDTLDYVPEYVKEMESKQRMNREFEIARTIQTKLLARTVPVNDRCDIACLCEPAHEVGGDYYDFVAFDDKNKLGVVIGDVAGKGVSAAFYMTLVKGILQTQAPITSHSARETLERVNHIFCTQVERGRFISMVYGIFDFSKNTVTIARAGHNPVYRLRSGASQMDSLVPDGMAIGLTQNDTFAEKLKETTIAFSSGDVFVFFTDGFSEAMNKHGEEFGEARLQQTLLNVSGQNSSAMIDALQKEIRSFVGQHPQHDDMTMIVIRIV
ncbi:MAG TPA: PP2C family protein-serine/threonine phosphatase [bacterium]|nr:PP2C family protein-serine/threonine phosphatase [bacterium]